MRQLSLLYRRRTQIRKSFYLITATPQDEIEIIMYRLKINVFFDGVYGAPKKKTCILRQHLEKNIYSTSEYAMIGDSMTDYIAAKENDIHFFLRETEENFHLFEGFSYEKLIL